MSRIMLNHTAFLEIPKPDIRYGRKNADFGQGFYTSTDKEFCLRWATERPGQGTFLNSYELETEGLKLLELERSEEWFEYIFANCRLKPDAFAEYDVITGPIANDTIYNTFGFISSGFLSSSEAVELLKIGPSYSQTVIKTERAAAQLFWTGARRLESREIKKSRESVAREEEEYMKVFSEVMTGFSKE